MSGLRDSQLAIMMSDTDKQKVRLFTSHLPMLHAPEKPSGASSYPHKYGELKSILRRTFLWALSRDDLSIDVSNTDKRVAVVRKCKPAEYGVSWVAAIDFDTRGTVPVNTPDPSFDGYMIDGDYLTTDEDINEFVKDIC